MMPYLTVTKALFILTFILNFTLATGTSTEDLENKLENVLTRLQELESTIIPFLLENIASLEEKVTDFEEHRRLSDYNCSLVLSPDGTMCQMDLPVIFLSDVTIDGNGSETTVLGDLKVEGNTVLQGGSTQIHSANVTMTGAVNMNDLMVGTSLEVVGPSMFASNIEVMQDAILDRDLTTKGHAHLFDLELDDALDVKGETRLEDSVWLIGDRHELHVDGDVTLEQTLTVNGETDLQDVTVEGQFVFNDQVVFNNDVEMEKLQVQDLTIDGTCVGCV